MINATKTTIGTNHIFFIFTPENIPQVTDANNGIVTNDITRSIIYVLSLILQLSITEEIIIGTINSVIKIINKQ